MKKKLNMAISEVVENIKKILNEELLSIYIYGSVVLNDFKLGWSDIDFLVLTKNKIKFEKASKLVTLRQQLLELKPKNKYFRQFEGAMLSLDGFLNQSDDCVVYWGTRGEKIKERYSLDSFSMKELLESGWLVCGQDLRDMFAMPTFDELYRDVLCHYQTIREHGQQPAGNLYSFGWFLDISRCIYTLQTGKIVAKTQAGKWALKNGICPDKKALKYVLKVRKNPQKYKAKIRVMEYAKTLAPSIKEYADVLEIKLNDIKKEPIK